MLKEFAKANAADEEKFQVEKNLRERLGPYIQPRKSGSEPEASSGSPNSTKVSFNLILHAYDLAAAHLASGLDLPPNIDQELYGDLNVYVTKYWWDMFAVGRGGEITSFGKKWGDEMRRLSIGRFVKDLKDVMVARVSGVTWDWGEGMKKSRDDEDGKVAPKLAIFSGHDTTVGPLLAALDGYRNDTRHIPDFRSNIAIELLVPKKPITELTEAAISVAKPQQGWWFWPSTSPVKKAEEDHFVRVRYNGRPLRIPACAKKGSNYLGDPTVCTFSTFMKVMDEVIPKDFDNACKPKNPKK
ncbi:hypothetical protein HDU97_006068 [Phlyctochytrium planicorne]|nr:hypothetical protein HDU97_006068 [Phlyctochytrium planicorne]